MKFKERFNKSDFHRVFNFQSEEGKGRSFLLLNMFLSNVALSIMNGALYTAFLVENGISMINVGIITFIPYITGLLSIFSPMIMRHFPRRQKLLLFNDTFFYVMILLGTTIMPLFVEDPTWRTVWLGIFLFIGHTCSALLGTGFNAWILRFIPKGKDMNTFVSYRSLLATVTLNATNLIASFAATMLENTPDKYWLLFGLRIGAFFFLLTGFLFIYLGPKEKPIEMNTEKTKPIHVFTESFKHKPFLLTALVVLFWGICSTFNANTFNYYLLETVNIPILFTYVGSIATMFSSLFLTNRFRKLIDERTTFRVMSYATAIFAVVELLYMFVRPGWAWLYVCVSALYGVVSVCYNIGFLSLYYLNLPDNVNRDLLSTFWVLVTQLGSFLGSAIGTWILARFEAHGMFHFFGLEWYGSQMLCGVKVLLFIGLTLYIATISVKLDPKRRLAA